MCPAAWSATFNVQSMDRADMVAAIAAAESGDTLVFPAGLANYSSAVTIDKPLTLRFVENQSIITNISGGENTWVLNVNTGSNSEIRISGLTIHGQGTASGIFVSKNQKNVRIDNCHFYNCRRHAVQFYGYESYGIVDHCTFYNNYTSVEVNGADTQSWNDPIGLGTVNGVWIEDCYFENNDSTLVSDLNNVIYFSNGARGGMRHCTVFGKSTVQSFSFWDSHGNNSRSPPWTDTSLRGTIYAVIHDNLIEASSSSNFRHFYIRGGTHVFANNTITGANGALIISLSEEESWHPVYVPHTSTWPGYDQIRNTWIVNNTYNGSPVTDTDITSSFGSHYFGSGDPLHDSDTIFIQLGRDYHITNSVANVPAYDPIGHPITGGDYGVDWLIYPHPRVTADDGGDFFVDSTHPGASDSNAGTEASPWRTIAKANSTLTAGDRVYIKAGTYSRGIQPANSGSVGQPIIYKRFETDEVIIKDVNYGIYLSGKSYIKVDGIQFVDNNGMLRFDNSMNIDVTDCVFSGQKAGSRNWSGVAVEDNSEYIKFLNCTFERWGYFTDNDDIGDMLDFGDESDPDDLTTRILVEGCIIRYAAHALVNLRSGGHIFRNNYMHNEAWSPDGHGGRGIISDSRATYGGRNLFEGNRIGYCAGGSDADATSAINLRTKNSILRRNMLYDNTDAGLIMDGGGSAGDDAINNKIYNNVFFNNGLETVGNVTEAHMGLQSWHSSFLVQDNSIKNNIFRTAPNVYWTSGASLSQQTFANNWEDAGDPLFIDVSTPYSIATPALPNFVLQSGSPCIDAGAFLTNIISPAGSGTTFKVDDASYYMDGWGIIPGDVIQLQGSSQRALITEVDYTSNTITVASGLSWTQNQGVALAYEGSAPDIGAYEFYSATTNPPAITSAPSAVPVTPTDLQIAPGN